MEIIQNFGIEPVLLVAQIINFLIILYVLKRFLYKPILSVLKNRQDEITLGLKQAEEARLLLEKTAEKEKAVLKNAQAQARILLDEAKQQKQEFMRTSSELAKKHADQIMQEARIQIAAETKEAEKRLTAHISSLALSLLEKSLSNIFTDNQQDVVVKQAAKRMKGKIL